MCFLSTISPTDLFEFSKHVLKFVLAAGSVYLILQRFHLRLQMRFLKNISDEIIKINDTCIEFSYKYAHFINDIQNKVSKIDKLKDLEMEDSVSHKNEIEYDEKLLSEVEILRAKTNNHLDYLASQISSFPYGNPINFFWFSLTGKYLSENVKIKTDEYLLVYQDCILQDSIIQTGIDLKALTENQDSAVKLLNQNEIDLIVINGIYLIEYLEDHSKKLF